MLVVSHQNTSNINVAQGTTNLVIERLSLAASAGDGITVSSILVNQTGSAISSDITSLKLILDVNNNGIYDAGETLLDSKTYTGAAVTFSPNLTIPASSTRYVMIAADLSPTAVLGRTIQTSITNGSIGVASPDSVASFSTLTSGIATITDTSDILTVSQVLLSSGSVNRSSTDNVIQSLNLSVNQDQATVSSITINRIGTAMDSDTTASGIKLWRDTDNSGTVNAGDTQVSTSKTFAGGTGAITFDGLNLNVTAGAPVRLLVTYSISSTAVTGATIGSRITTAASIVVSGTDTVSAASLPLTSNLKTIAASGDSLTVTHTPPSSFVADQGSTNKVLDRITLSAGVGDGITLSGLVVNQLGTALVSDMGTYRLINDANNNGIVDGTEGSTGVLDAKTISGATVTFAPAGGLVIAPGSTVNLLITVDITSTAVVS